MSINEILPPLHHWSNASIVFRLPHHILFLSPGRGFNRSNATPVHWMMTCVHFFFLSLDLPHWNYWRLVLIVNLSIRFARGPHPIINMVDVCRASWDDCSSAHLKELDRILRHYGELYFLIGGTTERQDQWQVYRDPLLTFISQQKVPLNTHQVPWVIWLCRRLFRIKEVVSDWTP